jgi:chemosensory pili system protein ChpC
MNDNTLLRTLLIPVKGTQLLVPSATVLEVLPFSQPRPVADSPDWILGTTGWRSGAIPVICLETLFTGTEPDLGSRTRLAVFNPVGEARALPQYAVLVQAVPRLVALEQHMIQSVEHGSELPDGVISKAVLASQVAFIPDLEHIEAQLMDAMALADEVV